MSTDSLAPAGDSALSRTGVVARIAILICAALVIAVSAIPLFVQPGERPHGGAYAGLAFTPVTTEAARLPALDLARRSGLARKPDERPGLVTEVEVAGPAWLAGMRARIDAVKSIDGVPITDRAGLERIAARVRPGDVLAYGVIRDSVVLLSAADSGAVGSAEVNSGNEPYSQGYLLGRQLRRAWSQIGKPSLPTQGGQTKLTRPLPRMTRHIAVPLEIRVRLDSLRPTGGRALELAIQFLAAAAFLALGLMVFLRRPVDPAATLFFLLSTCAAAGHVLDSEKWARDSLQGFLPDVGFAFGSNLLSFVTIALGVLFLVLLLHFTLIFPAARPVLARRPDSLRWLYVLAAVVALPSLPGMALYWPTLGGGSPLADSVGHLAWAVAIGASIATFIAVIAATRAGGAPPAGRSRLLTRPGLTGLALALLTAVVFIGAAGSVGRLDSVGALLAFGAGILLLLLQGLGTLALAIVCAVAAIVCLAHSYRDGGVEARRQIRWPLWGLSLGFSGTLALLMLQLIWFAVYRTKVPPFIETTNVLASALITLLIPASFAIAILKYRLMEIDVVIRRTVVYAALTGLLVAVYAVLVGGVGSIVGQAANTHSHWPTAFGTMAVAMVFFPARNRIQSLVDRRFFRTRFVATEALQRMSAVVSTTTQVPALMHAAVEEAQQALQSRTAAGFTFQPESHALAVVETIGLPDERRRELRTVLDEAAIGTLRSGAQLDSRALTGGLAALARLAGAELLVPIMHRGELRGLLTVGTKLSDQQIEPADREFLTAVAAQTGAGLANVESGARQRELEEARVIQAGLLPAELPALPGFDVAAYWQPAREVAGDLYDVFPVGEGFALCIADVTGKGMPAALLMSSLQATLRGAAALGLAPVPLIERVNRTMSTQMAAGRFATLFYGVLDPARRVLRYVNAGHNPPMLLRADGTCETLEIGGLLVGVFPEARYEAGEVTLRAGDRLLLYTDGITEAQNAAGDMFEEERLERELRGVPDGDAAAIQRRIIAATGEFCGGEWQDDATLVVLLTR